MLLGNDGKITVAFCGFGRAGKDEAGMFLASISPLVYSGSCSWRALPYVAKVLKLPEQLAWDTRHQRRMEWYHILNEYRREDPTRLVRDCIEKGDIIIGIRDKEELLTSKRAGILTHTIWVQRDSVPEDPTTVYRSEDCDLVIENNGTLREFFDKIQAWAVRAGIAEKAAAGCLSPA